MEKLLALILCIFLVASCQKENVKNDDTNKVATLEQEKLVGDDTNEISMVEQEKQVGLDGEDIIWADAKFEKRIRNILSKPSGTIRQSDLDTITKLELVNLDISNISDIVYFKNLRELNLYLTPVRDISPLSSLTKLTELNLERTYIKNISVLADLPNLNRLNLFMANISDISVLANLTNLTKLNLAYTDIIDINVLANLPNLTTLNLRSTDITDISVLASLPNLTELDLAYTDITDISVLANLPNLTELDLLYTDIIDISVLANLTNLTELKLTGTDITDINALTGLTNLPILELSPEVSDISALANLPNLSTIFFGFFEKHSYATNNNISDWSPVAHVENVYGKPRITEEIDGKTYYIYERKGGYTLWNTHNILDPNNSVASINSIWNHDHDYYDTLFKALWRKPWDFEGAKDWEELELILHIKNEEGKILSLDYKNLFYEESYVNGKSIDMGLYPHTDYMDVLLRTQIPHDFFLASCKPITQEI